MNDQSASYRIVVLERTKRGTGFTYVITHPDRPGWSESTAASFKSAQAAATAASDAIERLMEETDPK
jgi:hypothetical protein